jgi:hypothetical protein
MRDRCNIGLSPSSECRKHTQGASEGAVCARALPPPQQAALARRVRPIGILQTAPKGASLLSLLCMTFPPIIATPSCTHGPITHPRRLCTGRVCILIHSALHIASKRCSFRVAAERAGRRRVFLPQQHRARTSRPSRCCHGRLLPRNLAIDKWPPAFRKLGSQSCRRGGRTWNGTIAPLSNHLEL